jgi:hypothetical protein
MEGVDLSKMGIVGPLPGGGIGVIPTGQLGMQIPPQLMQMGIPNFNPQPGGGFQGIMMNPLMQVPKPPTDNK